MHSGVFSVVPGLCPPTASSISSPPASLATAPNVSKHGSVSVQDMSPWSWGTTGAGGRQGQGAALGGGHSFGPQCSGPRKLH